MYGGAISCSLLRKNIESVFFFFFIMDFPFYPLRVVRYLCFCFHLSNRKLIHLKILQFIWSKVYCSSSYCQFAYHHFSDSFSIVHLFVDLHFFKFFFSRFWWLPFQSRFCKRHRKRYRRFWNGHNLVRHVNTRSNRL